MSEPGDPRRCTARTAVRRTCGRTRPAHGAWECRACARVFTVKFTGLLSKAVTR